MSDPRIDAIIGQSALSPKAQADLQAVIDGSPYLTRVLIKAIEAQQIEGFAISSDPNEGGHYSRTTRTIGINPGYFSIPMQEQRLDALTGVVGHEVGHALMARSSDISVYRYAHDIHHAIKNAAIDAEANVDITAFAGRLVGDFRASEGLAELVSMNSMASRVATGNHGEFNKQEFLKRADAGTDCIQMLKLGAGIQLDADGQQKTGGRIESPAVEHVAACHFDAGAKTLGLKGTSSYHDYYAAYALGAAVDAWKDYGRGSTQAMPLIEVDLAALKTSKQGVEDAGIDLGGKGGGIRLHRYQPRAASDGQHQAVGGRCEEAARHPRRSGQAGACR